MNERQNPKDWNLLDTLLSGLMNIHEVGGSSLHSASIGELCDTVLASACDLSGAARGSLMLFDENRCELRIAASRGITQEVVDTLALKPGEGVAGMAFETGESIIIRDPKKHPDYVGYYGRPEQKEPFIAIPVRTRERVFGVLNLHLGQNSIPEGDYRLKMLSVLAAKAALSIENLRLHGTLQNFYMEMVETLARTIDAKDSYTHDHAGRARRKARRIAEVLKLPDAMIRQVEYAALLHDIGKIGVREAILLKPGKLTDEEYQEIKKHPVIGYQILSPVAFLNQVSQMVLYHQERFDGRGYPEGITGKAIPLGARIVSTIDAWDAMVSDRPYRKAMKRDTALGELRGGSGAQFDPDVVKVFMHLERTEWKSETQGK
jgi:hypothetical protein